MEDESGNGLHVNLSLSENEENLFEKDDPKAMSFMAGILRRMKEITAFANPLPSSYERLGQFKAPSTVSWSHQNRSTLVRIPYAEGRDSRMEVRSPDPSSNPYLLISLLLSAGFEGIEDGIQPEEETAGDAISQPCLERLPESLSEALGEARRSTFVKSVIPGRIVEGYLDGKGREVEEYEKNGSNHGYLIKRYFRFI